MVKRKVSLDHLRIGLKANDVLGLMTRNPDHFKPLLVYCEDFDKLTPVSFIDAISWEEVEQHEKVLLCNAIQKMTSRELSNLLQFVIGAPDLFLLKSRKIVIKIKDNVAGIFASSCSFELFLPKAAMTNESNLKYVLASATGNYFNTC